MKAGYKQTEVGVIPEGWEVKRLGTVIAIRNAKVNTFGADVASFCVELEQVGQNSGQIDGHSDARARQSVKYRFDQGDVLFGRLRPYLRKFWWADREGVCSTEIWPFIPVDGQLTSGFLFQTVQTDTFIQAANSSYGTHMPRADWSALTQFEILVPGDLAEQTAIATALSDVDGLLGGLDLLIAKKRDLKQAAMQQLLTGQTRLPGFHGEWDQMTLGELFTFKNGLNKGKEFFGFGTPIVNYMDVYVNTGIHSSMLEGRVSLTKQEIKNFDVRKGDVLFTRTSETPEEIGMASVILDEPDETVFSGFVLRGRPKNDNLCDVFKAYCFRSPAVRNQIISKASYTTRALTNGRILSAVTISVPSVPEQTAIAEVLSDIDAELAGLEQRREKTRALKQAMMQELLTGRTRLVSAESAYA